MSDRLKEVVANSLRISESEVNDSLEFNQLAAWDSLNHIALMLALEAEYGVTISDDMVLKLTSFRAIRDFISAETATQDGSAAA